ncbi:hypothetical protein ACRE_087330 [Hapsidospora chrysogenum ATCC 11550]|uniref:Uncharacterized protein n=1 Tax=Hapsidospora chrysogenum (strain ATCC 11550 / CBS 779.69 / DSM 880 / IAM 14645 / JCM 23072 / IMI 49137) TaxID=857340 RepID=A0A086STZ4_HAPC1|nr:hypothetical protein ACRE_087330 [Hapsidospora chrysogenum ATCC 11550]
MCTPREGIVRSAEFRASHVDDPSLGARRRDRFWDGSARPSHLLFSTNARSCPRTWSDEESKKHSDNSIHLGHQDAVG